MTVSAPGSADMRGGLLEAAFVQLAEELPHLRAVRPEGGQLLRHGLTMSHCLWKEGRT